MCVSRYDIHIVWVSYTFPELETAQRLGAWDLDMIPILLGILSIRLHLIMNSSSCIFAQRDADGTKDWLGWAAINNLKLPGWQECLYWKVRVLLNRQLFDGVLARIIKLLRRITRFIGRNGSPSFTWFSQDASSTLLLHARLSTFVACPLLNSEFQVGIVTGSVFLTSRL